MRLFGKDPLAMRRYAAAASYWVARTGGELRRDRLNEQF
jgi:hypothetical protein